MNLRFTNWYTQALGASFGIMTCIYSYLNGYMITYSNIDTYFDSLGIGGILSSYFLLPLCILTLFLAITKSYDLDKSFFNMPLESINVIVIISTVIIGFMGARMYFIIPSIFILFNLVSYKLINNKVTIENLSCKDNIDVEQYNFIDDDTVVFQSNTLNLHIEKNSLNLEEKEILDEKELKILSTKIEIAKELLSKNAEEQFIMDITGLTLKELDELKF